MSSPKVRYSIVCCMFGLTGFSLEECVATWKFPGTCTDRHHISTHYAQINEPCISTIYSSRTDAYSRKKRIKQLQRILIKCIVQSMCFETASIITKRVQYGCEHVKVYCEHVKVYPLNKEVSLTHYPTHVDQFDWIMKLHWY